MGFIDSYLESSMTSITSVDVKGTECLLKSEESTCESHQKKQVKVSSRQKSVQWEICNKILKYKSNLKMHMALHTGLKEFKCLVCNKEFAQKSHLNSHSNTHTNLNEYKCDVCSKEFIHNDDLKRHLKTHIELKEFKCYFCSREFHTKFNLENHLKIHSGIKEFKCHICSREFFLKSGMKRHLKSHSDLREFKCEFCCKVFKFSRGLKKHICGDELSNELYLHRSMLKHNNKTIVVQKSSSNKEDMNMIAMESDPDVDPLLIEDEISPPVKEEVPNLTLSEETSSMFHREDFIGNECTVKVENNIDNDIQKNICDAGDVVDNLIKVEKCSDDDDDDGVS